MRRELIEAIISLGNGRPRARRDAFLAAADDAPIDKTRLIRGANRELENTGRRVMH